MKEETKTTVNEKIKDKLTDNTKVAAYLDINVALYDNDEIIGYLHKFGQKVNVTVAIPSDLPKIANNYTRTYSVIRIHNDEVTVIDGDDVTVNDDGTITFKTDRFSNYVLTYTDTANSANPQTSDNILISIIMAIVSIISLAIMIIYVKKNKVRA